MIKPGVELDLGGGRYLSQERGQICLRMVGEQVFLEPAIWYEILAWFKYWRTSPRALT